MHEDLFPYFENELAYLRKFGNEFAETYPAAASALRLENDRCLDPHVERLLEGVALLTGRIRKKLDDEFPEITNALLSMLYPHYTAQIPALGIVQFQIDPQAVRLTSKYTIKKGTILNTIPYKGMTCQFRTCYSIDLLPVTIESISISQWNRHSSPEPGGNWNAQAVLTLNLKSLSGLTFGEFECSKLRIYLNGTPLSYRLYKLIGNDVTRIEVSAENNPNTLTNKKSGTRRFLSEKNIRPVGFDTDEGLVPFPENSFTGYRLLQEFFAFPEKFLFYDIDLKDRAQSFPSERFLSVHLYLKEMPGFAREITKSHFALGCTPIVNLFDMDAVPVLTNPAKSKYRILPKMGKPEQYEIYSVNKVEATDLNSRKTSELEPFYTFKHSLKPQTSLYWYTSNEPASDSTHENFNKTYINLCTLGFQKKYMEEYSLRLQTTCTNRNTVKKIPGFKNEQNNFTANDIPSFGFIKALVMQTEPIRTPGGREDEFFNVSNDRRLWRGGYWRLISHLSLNHLSLGKGGIQALQSLLQLYDIKGIPQNENLILGLVDIKTKQVNRLIQGAVCRGLNIQLTVDTERFKESSYYLLTAILDRFFAIYASINSFTQVTVIDNTQQERILKEWSIRAGESAII